MRRNSTLIFLLKALVPYSRENLALSFKPSKFFADMERASGRNKEAIRQSYRRAQRNGLITADPVPRLTVKGKLKLAPFEPETLGKEAQLMIIFDIPEHSSLLRTRLRRLLKNLQFEQAQKSVWLTKYDYRDILQEAIEELDLAECVQLYECAPLKPKTRT